MHISPYEKGNIFNKDPLRPRKLLMHKKEIQKMVGKIAQKGYTIVPVEVYFKGSLVKVQVALAKGKKLYDKRQDIAKKTSGGKPNGISKCGILDRCFAKKAGGRSYIFAPRGKRSAVKLSLRKILMRGNIFCFAKTLQGLVMVSTGIMQLEKRVVRDTLNSTIKIKR